MGPNATVGLQGTNTQREAKNMLVGMHTETNSQRDRSSMFSFHTQLPTRKDSECRHTPQRLDSRLSLLPRTSRSVSALELLWAKQADTESARTYKHSRNNLHPTNSPPEDQHSLKHEAEDPNR